MHIIDMFNNDINLGKIMNEKVISN